MRNRFFNRPLNWRTLIIVAAGVVEMFLLTMGGIKMLEFTDSSEFCGQLCHQPMTPEFNTYQISPHSRVTCAQCHVGSGASYFVKSKVSGLPLVVATVFNTYERPIHTPVRDLRPARDTCENCHWPQKFSEDRIRTFTHYLQDEANTRQHFQLAMRVGGGEATTATGIHWHVSSRVWYLPLDERRQEIAWVGVENSNGTLTEYFDPARTDQVTPERINEEKLLVDCIDCHNRATHIFRSPDDLIDGALSQGRMDSDLPYIKKLGVDALDVTNPSESVTESKIAAIETFYRQQYPGVYDSMNKQIREAQETLRDLEKYVIFPYMKVTWQTHLNNATHDGCFRCHGTLTTTPAQPSQNLVSNSCDNCHYSLGNPVTPGEVPHSLEGRAECLGCHGLDAIKPYPQDHVGRKVGTCTSCHVPSPPAPPVAHMVQGSISGCLACHGPGQFKGYPANHNGRANDTCSLCHSMASSPRSLAGSSIPHALEGRADCLACHGPAAARPFPPDHSGRSNGTCTLCHSLGTTASTIPHTIQGLNDCLSCHGAGTFQAFPANHVGRDVASCTGCHTTSTTARPLAGTAIPHQAPQSTDCLACHGTGKFEAFPSNHSGRPLNTCSLCHSTAASPRPLAGQNIPHSLEGRSECTACHGRGSFKPFPANHDGRTNDICQTCHNTG